jgi:SpoVK/Ycf46/Vps4 family AAA+-type ATPase
MPLSDEDPVDLQELVTLSQGFSGAEVVSSCTEAAILAIGQQCDSVQQRHLRSVMKDTKPQISEAMLDYYSRITQQFYS